MPLLCISLLALLLLPLSLTCDSIRPPKEVRSSYSVIVKTHLDNTRGNIRDLLNTSCPELKQKLRNCTANHTTIVSTLHFLTCKMKTLGLSHTDTLAGVVLNSINCPCVQKSTNRKVRTARRRRRNEHNKSKETKNLCKAKAILSAVTECYEMLSSQFTDT